MKSSPQENQRLDVPGIFLEAAIEGVRTHVHNTCAQIVLISTKLDLVNGMMGGK
jgi:hypothetical protein